MACPHLAHMEPSHLRSVLRTSRVNNARPAMMNTPERALVVATSTMFMIGEFHLQSMKSRKNVPEIAPLKSHEERWRTGPI